MLLLGGGVVGLPEGAVVRGAVVVLGVVVVPEFMPPMLVVGDVLPIGGVVPVVVFGVVPVVVFGVVPEVVFGVVPVVVLVVPMVDVEPGIVVVVDAPGVTAGEVDGVHRPELLELVLEDMDVLLPTDELLPIVLPVGFVEVLGVVEAGEQLVEA